tara:strand:+ start:2275 stop:3147 length:873 start_codon:yes stop_codon:yes gene_type:complete
MSVLAITVVLISSMPLSSHASAEDPVIAAMYDVVVFDSNCIEQQMCEGERIQHLVEYYGADWCEPCELIEEQLELLNRSDTFVLQHHPSPQDSSFLSASKIRFSNEHRLLFIPSLVIDSKGLLTGSSQALELSNALSQRNSTFAGLTNINIDNGTLTWQSSLGDRISVWRTEAIDHQTRNRTHPTLATDFMQFNASNNSANISSLTEDLNGHIVVILEQSGTFQLVSDSSNPMGGFELNQEIGLEKESDQSYFSPGQNAILWTGILVLILFPALYIRWKLSSEDVLDEKK